MIFTLFIISLFLPTRNHAMEAPDSDTKESVTVYVANDVLLSIPSKTATWLKENSSTIRNMMEDCDVKGSQDIYLPTISAAQFSALTAFAQQERPFKKLCKGPIVKKLIDLLHVAENLDIKPLQDAITDEVAYRYAAYPSLARRHNNLSALAEKYRPQFIHSHAESEITRKINEKNIWSGEFSCVKVIDDTIRRCCISYDRKQIIGKASKDIFIGDATTGELSKSCTFNCSNRSNGYNGNLVYRCRPTTNINDVYIIGLSRRELDDNKILILDVAGHSQKTIDISFVTSCLISECKKNAFITADNNKIIFNNKNHLIIFKSAGLKDGKEQWEKHRIDINPSPYDWCSSSNGPYHYVPSFNVCPYVSKDSKYVIFAYRHGIKKLNLDTYQEQSFNCVRYGSGNEYNAVSALAVTSDESKILLGTCETDIDMYTWPTSCETFIKVLDFNTGAQIKTIDTKPMFPKSGDYDKWPYEYIGAIALTHNDTIIVVTSKKMQITIIDFATGKLIQKFNAKTNKPSNSQIAASFLAVNADGTRIIAGYNPLAIYGIQDLDPCLKTKTPLQEILKILGGR